MTPEPLTTSTAARSQIMDHDPLALRVARRHLATVPLRDHPWIEFGRVSSGDLQKLVEPHLGPVTDLRIVATPTSVAWTAIDADGGVVWGQIVPRAIVVSDTEIILGANVSVGPHEGAGIRIDLVDVALPP
jgi:hypothetical protein